MTQDQKDVAQILAEMVTKSWMEALVNDFTNFKLNPTNATQSNLNKSISGFQMAREYQHEVASWIVS